MQRSWIGHHWVVQIQSQDLEWNQYNVTCIERMYTEDIQKTFQALVIFHLSKITYILYSDT